MFNIDYRNNIEINSGDDGIIDLNICGEPFEEGDSVFFHSPEQHTLVQDFHKGTCKIYIEKHTEAVKGKYCIKVVKADGRTSTVADAKFIRRKDCE